MAYSCTVRVISTIHHEWRTVVQLGLLVRYTMNGIRSTIMSADPSSGVIWNVQRLSLFMLQFIIIYGISVVATTSIRHVICHVFIFLENT